MGFLTNLITTKHQKALEEATTQAKGLVHLVQSHPDPNVKGYAMEQLVKQAGLSQKEGQNLMLLVSQMAGAPSSADTGAPPPTTISVEGSTPSPVEAQPMPNPPLARPGEQPISWERLAGGQVPMAPPVPPAQAPPPPRRGFLGTLGEVGKQALAGGLSQGRTVDEQLRRREIERQSQLRSQEMERQQRLESQLRREEYQAETPWEVERAGAIEKRRLQIQDQIAQENQRRLERDLAMGEGRLPGESLEEFRERKLAMAGVTGLRPPPPKEITIRNVVKPDQPGKFFTQIIDAYTGKTLREEEQAPPAGTKVQPAPMRGTAGELEDSFVAIREKKLGRPLNTDERMVERANAADEYVRSFRSRSAQQEISEGDVSEAAQAVLDYRMAPSQLNIVGGFGVRGQQFRQRVLGQVLSREPQFDLEAAEAGYQFGKATQTQQRIRLIDSVRRAMPILRELSARAKRRNIQFLNWATLRTELQLSESEAANFIGAAVAVQDEIGQIFQGGTGSATSDAKIALAGQLTNTNLSHAAFTDLLDTIDQLIEARRLSIIRGTFIERQSPAQAPAAAPGSNPFR